MDTETIKKDRRFAFIELRLANVDDFRIQITPGNYLPKWNVAYFEKKANGEISKEIKYLTDQSDKAQFRNLFEANQIYVFASPNEVIKIIKESEL